MYAVRYGAGPAGVVPEQSAVAEVRASFSRLYPSYPKHCVSPLRTASGLGVSVMRVTLPAWS
ncbi:hypothetical protein STENM327S_02334 [Streptomyces tendae]